VFERLGTHIKGEGGCTAMWGLSIDLFGLWKITCLLFNHYDQPVDNTVYNGFSD
jgi:hypothetical protein